jgi:hypothetical protein
MNRQARLLLPEPLAVNKGERVVGTIHFKVRPLYRTISGADDVGKRIEVIRYHDRFGR